MTKTRWVVDGPDETSLELGGRKFSSNDEGGPMMCNFVCTSMGRHVHIDYCRAEDGGRCSDAETEHISDRMAPNPNKPKDAITHRLHWSRMGASTILTLCRLENKHCLQVSKVTDMLPSSGKALMFMTRPVQPQGADIFCKMVRLPPMHQ
jgi:hypothetical protein